jgi:Zinc carboxypeptidase/Secretion system C-terminal sorting domain
MLRFIFLIVFLQVFSGLSFAQEKLHRIDSILNERGEVYVSVPHSRLKSTSLQAISYRIDQQRNDSLFLYLGKNDREYILSELENLDILTPPSQQFQLKMASEIDEVLAGTAYPTYSQYLEIMQMFRDSFPEVCSVDTVGKSTNGRLLLAARLGTSQKSLYELPRVLLSSTIHGDEVVGYSMMLLLLNELLENNQTAEVRGILDNLNLFIIPLTNPDGTYYSSNETVSGAIYFNANGVNLNRNFPDPSSGDHPDRNLWQKETIAMMSFLDKIRPNISANYHGGAEVVNYPFDTWAALHADDDWLRFISREYADTAMHFFPGYMSSLEFDNGITNGYAWYSVDGGMQDYVTWFLRGRELTIEISNDKTPPASSILAYWNANRNSMYNLIRQAIYGIHGEVTNVVDNSAIEAEIRIMNHDSLHSEVFSRKETGMFFRYLKEGIYDLEIYADGYWTKHIDAYQVEDYFTQNLFIELMSDEIITYPNPFENDLNIFLNSDTDDKLFVKIWALNGSVVYENYYSLTQGENQINIIPRLQSNGLYILELRDKVFTKKIKIVHQKGQ